MASDEHYEQYEFLWDGMWLMEHHRITVGADLPASPEESEGNAVSRLVHQYVSALSAACERIGINLQDVTPFNSFSYVAALTPTHVEIVFGPTNQSGRYALHRDLRNKDSQTTLGELDNYCRSKMGWRATYALELPVALLDLSFEQRASAIESEAERLAARFPARAASSGDSVSLNPISLFPQGPFARNEHLCFVLMPFADAMKLVYDDAIVPAATGVGLECKRADDILIPGGIMALVWQSLMEARVVIADLTDSNPNVFYELGLAHVIGHDVILLTQDMKFVPFDLRHMRCLVYEPSAHGLKILEQRLRRTLREVLK